jgi:hypothetical protein
MKILLFLIIIIEPLRATSFDSLPTFAEVLRERQNRLEKTFVESKPPNFDHVSLDYQYDLSYKSANLMFNGWVRHFAAGRKRIFVRVNEMDGCFIRRTLHGNFINFGTVVIHLPNFATYKIAFFEEGNYCEGIEYDFEYIGQRTKLGIMSPLKIVCE